MHDILGHPIIFLTLIYLTYKRVDALIASMRNGEQKGVAVNLMVICGILLCVSARICRTYLPAFRFTYLPTLPVGSLLFSSGMALLIVSLCLQIMLEISKRRRRNATPSEAMIVEGVWPPAPRRLNAGEMGKSEDR